MKHRILFSIIALLFSVPLLSADTKVIGTISNKIEYYTVKVGTNLLNRRTITVPKALFDLAINHHCEDIPQRKQLFGYEESTSHVIHVQFMCIPGCNYVPAENKHTFHLELVKYSPLEKEWICRENTKHTILKRINEKYINIIQSNKLFVVDQN